MWTRDITAKSNEDNPIVLSYNVVQDFFPLLSYPIYILTTTAQCIQKCILQHIGSQYFWLIEKQYNLSYHTPPPLLIAPKLLTSLTMNLKTLRHKINRRQHFPSLLIFTEVRLNQLSIIYNPFWMCYIVSITGKGYLHC